MDAVSGWPQQQYRLADHTPEVCSSIFGRKANPRYKSVEIPCHTRSVVPHSRITYPIKLLRFNFLSCCATSPVAICRLPRTPPPLLSHLRLLWYTLHSPANIEYTFLTVSFFHRVLCPCRAYRTKTWRGIRFVVARGRSDSRRRGFTYVHVDTKEGDEEKANQHQSELPSTTALSTNYRADRRASFIP